MVNATDNKQFERAIQKLGSVEILEPTVNVKALRFKMDFWMKAMRGQAKKIGTMNQKTLEQSTAVENGVDGKAINMLPPLDCESDIWILSRESDCKKIISRWMVKMMGPSPYVASWNDVPGKQNVWTFEIKKSFAEMFVSASGAWFFKGDQKPEFNWQENRWMFTGENLELFFFDTKAFSRLKVDNRILKLAGNSHFAKTKESIIVDTFNKDLVFKNEAELLKGNTLEFENEGDLGGNLEGKVKDKSESAKGNLHGKVKDQEEIADGKLKGKIKDAEEAQSGNLSGKSNGEESAESQDKKHGQASDQIRSNWDGKLSPEEVAAKQEKDQQQHNDKLQSNWGGKLTPAEMKAKEEKEHQQHNEKLQNNWGGKSSSDSINTKGVSAPGIDGLNEGSLLDLKKTEKEHQTHYKNHNEATKYEADETRKNQYQSSDESDLGGKSSTDKLSAHYGGRQNTDSEPGKAKEKKKSPFADMPKGRAEKISSHMASSKRPPAEKNGIDFDLDSGSERGSSASSIAEDLQLDSFETNGSANVLPFADKAKGNEDLNKITESASITSFISQNGNKYECALDDYFDNTVIFVCKGDGLKNSEKAKLDITLDYHAKQTNIKCDGVVLSIDQDENSGFFVTVEVSPTDAKKFDEFMDLLKSRQENIDTFLQRVKGY